VRSFAVSALVLAHLGLVSGSVHGAGFKRHEHVTVHIRVGARAPVTRHATASQAGTFVVALGRYPCGRFQISATGTAGSRATLKGIKLPRCLAT
jgi:hypothetical protein